MSKIHTVLSGNMRKLLPASRRAEPPKGLFMTADPQILQRYFLTEIRQSLQVARDCCASAQQADFQNGFPGVTKPEGSLLS